MSAPVKIPSALSMMLKSFGINPEKIVSILNDLMEKSETILTPENLDRIFSLVETVERIDKNLILLLEKKENGEPGS